MKPTLYEYRNAVYSQCGEDGILDELLTRLDIDSGWFCEFGAWDGIHLSNTYNLVDNSEEWRGVLIEGDTERYHDLEETVAAHPDRLWAVNEFVTATGENALDNILADTPIPSEFELLSIDVDGPDYFIWENLTEYDPTVVVIEYNCDLGPELRFVSDMHSKSRYVINPDAGDHPANFPRERKGEIISLFGSSFRSLVRLGQSKGYVPVSCTRSNLIFVAEDLAPAVELSPEEYDDPATLFLDEWARCPKTLVDPTLGTLWRSAQQYLRTEGVVTTGKETLSTLRKALF